MGRSNFLNSSITQELVHDINKLVRGGNIMRKIDKSKAYDMFDWDFLFHVLSAFVFSAAVCHLIKKCVSMPWFSVDGMAKGFFKGGRSLCQGDPISCLFCLF